MGCLVLIRFATGTWRIEMADDYKDKLNKLLVKVLDFDKLTDLELDQLYSYVVYDEYPARRESCFVKIIDSERVKRGLVKRVLLD